MSDTAQRTSVTIRDATADDIDFIAWVELTASRSHVPIGIWEYINGTNEQETLKFLATLAGSESTHWCHHSLFQIAEVDGAPVAAMCGFDPATQGTEVLMQEAPAAVMSVGNPDLDFPGMMDRGAIVQRVVSHNEPGAWVVENVATRPEFRRHGVADKLLKATLDRGREKGFELAQISVFIRNDPARAAYVKAGFEKVDEKRDEEFEAAMGFPGFERMLQKL